MSMPPQPGPYGPPGGWQQQPGGPPSGGLPQQQPGPQQGWGAPPPGGGPAPGGPQSGGLPQQPGPGQGWGGPQQQPQQGWGGHQHQGWGGPQQPGHGPQYDPAGPGGPGGPKKSPLPWILGGGGVLVVALIVVLVILLSGDDSDGGSTDAGGSGSPGDSQADGGGGGGEGSGGVAGSPEQTATLLADAATNEDYQTFVDLTCTRYQDEMGVSDIEDFATDLDPGAIDPSLAAIEVVFSVDSVEHISPEEAEARMLISYSNVPAEMADYMPTEMAMFFTLVPEDGQWKVCDYRLDESTMPSLPTY
ncbi:hypothetical protein FHR81_000250 [Actinoalloteichus hoggarensis]|uniref:Uncharacterized protein n=1 Tax=Actinoalloteichus hoggarensis TaxID=1470176 RepID=A0A221W2P7_9PSEU|nr:hypothetical protein [Actinoalloteichus hoggarensis]ASO20068.1 hypothetical protein AHOG_12125 [Actinoalloteichus hoggarensis]MBB5919221.1 hypothetical protein [Actinoalloteichus hoggarensis]